MLRKNYRLRLNLLFLVPVLFLSGLAPRLYYLQVIRRPYYQKRAAEQQYKPEKIVPCRGKILDRNGRELAGSTLLDTVYVAPAYIKPEYTNELAHDLAQVLKLDFDTVHKKLTGKAEVPLVRKLDPEKVMAIRAVKRKHKKIPDTAVYFLKEGKRFYPRDDLASHIIGYTEPNDLGDNKGLAGIERTYDAELRGNLAKYKSRTNAARATLEPVDNTVLASTFGNNIVLTIDETIQHAAEVALKKRVREVMADAGVAVVSAVRTGELLAIASCPSYNLNDLRNASSAERRNRALTDAIEPGSVMKALTFAMLLEEKKVSLDDSFDCEGGGWTMANGRFVEDTHKMGYGTVRDVFRYSSNIGTIKAASRVSSRTMYDYLVRFGLGSKTGLDLTGEGSGIVRPFKSWDGFSMSSLPVGYELQVSAIQMSAAMGAIVNGGWYMKPHIVKEIQDYRGETVRVFEPEKKRRVISQATSRKMLELLELVIMDGTAKTARLDYHRAGGKTGTTKKVDSATGKYVDGQYVASFCGVAPIENPEICVYVWIDNPQVQQYGGQASAPVFKEIAEATLKVLKVPASSSVRPQPGMDVVMEKMREKWETELQDVRLDGITDDDDVATGSMPNLRGLTMREAREKLNRLNMPFTFTGSGVVVSQKPRAYETLERGAIAQMTFGPESSLLSEIHQVDGGMDLTQQPTTETQQLVIQQGNRSVVLPMSATNVTTAPLLLARLPKPVQATPTPMPDVDPYAQRTPDLKAGKQSWSRWEKERKNAPDEQIVESEPRSDAPKTTKSPAQSRKIKSQYDVEP